MKRIMFGLALMLAVVLAVGCTRSAGGDAKPGGGGFAYVKTPFEKVEPGKEPAPVAKELAEMQAKAATKAVVHEGATYAVITAGEKSTGGWNVIVESVGDSEGKLEVVYRVEGPKAGSMNTQAITYPSVVVKFQNTANLPIEFKEAK